MGIRLGGCEQPLEDLIKQHAANHGASDRPYTLIEIGSAGCVTLRAFADILRECGKPQWRAVGFDLTLDKAWSVNMDEVRSSFAGLPEQIITTSWDCLTTLGKGMSLYLMDDPRRFWSNRLFQTVDFAFIDASHGISCARDFEAIESKIAPGGLVVFHDYGEPEQGSDFQNEDREFISVRSYVHRLGLNAPSPNGVLRKGWRWVGEIKGSRHWGQDGNSCAVVQRTNEPLQRQPELSVDAPTDLNPFWRAHSEWSQTTFGTDAERGPTGPLKHLAKEVGEVLDNPKDLTEHADCLLLLCDAARRSGFTCDQLLAAAWAKLEVNKARKWSVPTKGDEAVEHVRE